MSYPHHGQLAVGFPGNGWVVAIDGPEASGGLASSPMAVPAFFAAWVAVGVVVALRLARRGHDRRTMVALGSGLGPLMLVVAADTALRREGEAMPLVLEPGVHHGGHLDVLVLIQDDPRHVRSLLPTLSAVRSELGELTLARAVDYEWIDGDLENEVVQVSSTVLREASRLMPVDGATLALHPGTQDTVATRFKAQRRRALVLIAIGDSVTRPASPGHR